MKFLAAAPLATLAFTLLFVTPTFADDKPTGGETREGANKQDPWMQVKLSATQHALASLTAGDFETLEQDASRLLVLNVLENWLKENKTTRSSEYQGQVNAFEFATKELIRTARAQDAEGALKSFQALSASCVHCHQLVRDSDQ